MFKILLLQLFCYLMKDGIVHRFRNMRTTRKTKCKYILKSNKDNMKVKEYSKTPPKCQQMEYTLLQCETFLSSQFPVKHGDFAIVDDDDDKVGCYL